MWELLLAWLVNCFSASRGDSSPESQRIAVGCAVLALIVIGVLVYLHHGAR